MPNNINRTTTQGFSFQINSQGKSKLSSYQSTEIGPSDSLKHRQHDRDHDRFRDPFDSPRHRDQRSDGPGHSRHDCKTIDLFPRRPDYPGLDTKHGRQDCYQQAYKCNDANRLLELARAESELQLMPDIKAGDLLRQSYHAALACNDAQPLLGIAELENSKQLMPDIKAGDVLRQAYHTALKTNDSITLIDIAKFEEANNLMPDIKAGDILRQAQQMTFRPY